MFCVCPNKKKGLMLHKNYMQAITTCNWNEKGKKNHFLDLNLLKKISILVFLIRKYWKKYSNIKNKNKKGRKMDQTVG